MRQPFGKTWYSEVNGIGFHALMINKGFLQEEERENP